MNFRNNTLNKKKVLLNLLKLFHESQMCAKILYVFYKWTDRNVEYVCKS